MIGGFPHPCWRRCRTEYPDWLADGGARNYGRILTRSDGRGELGRTLTPLPRNFGRGIFKYSSTPAGALPTDADLERTIRGGLAGTVMPIFSDLSERELKSVIEYVKSFSARWRNPKINTTPMPSFASTLTEEQRWELVAFIAELRRSPASENPL